MISGMVYDRTAADVAAKNAKGLYRYTDLNRVQNAVAAVRARYVAAGYDPAGYDLPTWAENDIPRTEQMRKYLASVRAFHGLVNLWENPVLPTSMDELTYIGANNIERFLVLTDEAMDLIEGAWFYSDEILSGEVDL